MKTADEKFQAREMDNAADGGQGDKDGNCRALITCHDSRGTNANLVEMHQVVREPFWQTRKLCECDALTGNGTEAAES